MYRNYKISDDSGFMGIANLNKYESFVDSNWDFEMLKKRIVDQINLNNILFWSTGREDIWNVQVTTSANLASNNFYRIEEGLIEVTDEKLYLVNYETLSMAAQFKHIKLPEDHLTELYIELENGFYLVELRQTTKPTEVANKEDVDFEIRLEIIEDESDYYPNNFGNIFWNVK